MTKESKESYTYPPLPLEMYLPPELGPDGRPKTIGRVPTLDDALKRAIQDEMSHHFSTEPAPPPGGVPGPKRLPGR